MEDSVNGATSAVAAGFPTIGIVQFVPASQRSERAAALAEVGVALVVERWSEVLDWAPVS